MYVNNATRVLISTTDMAVVLSFVMAFFAVVVMAESELSSAFILFLIFDSFIFNFVFVCSSGILVCGCCRGGTAEACR